MTDAEALRIALDLMSKREIELTKYKNRVSEPSEAKTNEYGNLIAAMDRIEQMLRKPRQRGF